MARYYSVMVGLRGLYMPSYTYAIRVKTRRELKETLTEEARGYMGDERTPSQRDVAAVAAALWRRRPTDRDAHLDTVLPLGDGTEGVQVAPITRDEWRDALDAEEG